MYDSSAAGSDSPVISSTKPSRSPAPPSGYTSASRGISSRPHMAAFVANAPPSSRRSGPTGRCMSIVSWFDVIMSSSSVDPVESWLVDDMKDGGGPPNCS